MTVLYLAVDPGRDKCGLAVAGADGAPVLLRAAALPELPAILSELAKKYSFSAVLLGDGTGSGRLFTLLAAVWAKDKIILADERDTTLTGRELYWRHNPPEGWKKYLPRALLTPAGPLDAYAAWAIALKWLGKDGKSNI